MSEVNYSPPSDVAGSAAIAALTESLRSGPDDAELYLARGQAHEQLGEAERALADYTTALQLLFDQAVAAMNRSVAAAARGDFDTAGSSAEQARGINVHLATAYALRGGVFRVRDELEQAAADCNQALRLDPANATAYATRGEVYRQSGAFPQAIADSTAALRLDADLVAAYQTRARAYAATGRYAEARADFTAALRLGAGEAGAALQQGEARYRVGDCEGAREDFDRACRLARENPLPYLRRGIAHRCLGQATRALADFDEALRLDPGCAPAYYHRGLTRFDAGDQVGAVADHSTALDLDPDFTAACLGRGLALRRLGEHARAEADFRRAAAFDPMDWDAFLLAAGSAPGAGRSKRSAANRPERPATASPPEITATLGFEQTARAQPASSASEPTPAAPAVIDPQVGTETTPAHEPAGRTETSPPVKKADGPGAGLTSLRVVCPVCGVCGTVPWERLDKALRCPGCKNWFRTDRNGKLAAIPSPAVPPAAGTWVEVRSGVGSRQRRWVPDRPGKRTASAASSPARRFFRLRYGVAAAALATGLAILLIFHWSKRGELETRGDRLARAWLARDEAGIMEFTDPSGRQHVKQWLAANPPPAHAAGSAHPRLKVLVERNDGKSADVVLQVPAKDQGGPAAVVVFYQRWVEKDGTWYFSPSPGRRAPAGGSKRRLVR